MVGRVCSIWTDQRSRALMERLQRRLKRAEITAMAFEASGEVFQRGPIVITV